MRGPREPSTAISPQTASHALWVHWRLYLYEGAELAWFMVAACGATVVLFGAGSPVVHAIASAAVRRFLMGLAMGTTAILIIHSPIGKRSGAHFNPAITLTYLWLGKIAPWDAAFYVLGQFAGGVAGVGLSALVLGRHLAQPSVEYAVTVPGLGGPAGAFAAELFMGTLLMGVVLWASERSRFAPYTSYMVGGADRELHLLFRAGLRLQHQSRADGRLGDLCRSLDSRVGVLCGAAGRDVRGSYDMAMLAELIVWR